MRYCITSLLAIFLLLSIGCFNNLTEPQNQAPSVPSNPYPADNATGQSANSNLNWVCSDPDGDMLVYTVYFGKSSSPPLVSTDQASTNYDPGSLDYNTMYYWQITAKDPHKQESSSEIWNFTTVGVNDNWEEYRDASGTYYYSSGNYYDPDPDKGSPWISLSSYGITGATVRWEFYGFNKADVETLEIGAYSYDNGSDLTGGEHYKLYNHSISTWEFIFDSDKSEGWRSHSLTGDDARKYIRDSDGAVLLGLVAGATDHSHIREVFCKQATSGTSE